MPGTRNGIRLQISWWVWLVLADFTNVIKAFKEIGKQKVSKAIEYRNTTRICVDRLQVIFEKK